ncbi:response regulator [Paenibacillus silvisoli]|uniref:response regulator n=1 Tax=Paenibacillus silvisoli TaxID=3110539 RepID=UPI002805006A|nr:response regulator [Paenibacillus silvisoli]
MTVSFLTMLFNESTGLYHRDFIQPFIRWKLADMPRSHSKFTLLAIEICEGTDESDAKQVSRLIAGQIRNTDFLFATNRPDQFKVVLPYSGTLETEYFVKRLYRAMQEQLPTIKLTSGMVEVAHGTVSFDELMAACEEALKASAAKGPFHLESVTIEVEPPEQTVKVSIIEDSDMMQNILTSMMNGIVVEGARFQQRIFQDGNSFVQSDWHHSGHTQLIFLNDILPERDGIELLSDLRSMPNANKYIILMLGSRNTENDIIYSLEHGADEYIPKPFNIRLMVAKVKRMLERLK